MVVGLLGRGPKFALFPFMGGLIDSLGFIQLGQDGILITDTAFNSSGALLASCSGGGCSPYPIDLIMVFLALGAYALSMMVALGK